MKVTLDASRILHLIVLVTISSVGTYLLVECLDWTPYAAFGFVCTIVTQCSNAVMLLQSNKHHDNNKGASRADVKSHQCSQENENYKSNNNNNYKKNKKKLGNKRNDKKVS